MSKMVTNEEKAKEIANKSIVGYGPKYFDVAEESALKMAEWKDEQFVKEKQTFINKSLHSFCSNCPSFECNECCCCFGVCDAYEMFHKKLMEEIE